MRIETICENRKELVKAMAEILGEPSKYLGPPSFGYQIGGAIVDRDGNIETEDGEMLQKELQRRGFIEEATPIHKPSCPVYQNVSTKGETCPETIKANLIAQLTAPVRWTQSVQNMIADGADHFIELGPGAVLQGLVKKINKEVTTEGMQ